MKKILIFITTLVIPNIIFAQTLTTPNNVLGNKPNVLIPAGKKVLYDIQLNYLALAEATRNRIDNGDCKRIGGNIAVRVYEINNHNEKVAEIKSYYQCLSGLYFLSDYIS